jgi:hypothetical protein
MLPGSAVTRQDRNASGNVSLGTLVFRLRH